MPVKREFAKPLRIVLCRSADPECWGAKVGQSLELTLFGDPDTNREDRWEPLDLAAAVPLDEEIEFKRFTAPPTKPEDAQGFLDEALHTLVVVLVDDPLLRDAALLDWLQACAATPGMESARHQLFVLLEHEGIKKAWLASRPELGRYQGLLDHELGEEAERVDWLGLRLLHAALRLAARGSGVPPERKVRFFVSHAKRDGLALARALRDLLTQTAWLEKFYDASDLGSERPWEKQLEDAVATSVLLALRTDNYDHRPWCQLEVQWAEEYGAPMVLVDARGGLVHAASALPFEAAPCLRIPDGNLVRIVHAGLRVAARAQLFRRRVIDLQTLGLLPAEPSLQVISVQPGMGAIARACRAFGDAPQRRFICHPGPLLQRGRLEAAKALAASVDAEIGTPADLLLILEAAG